MGLVGSNEVDEIHTYSERSLMLLVMVMRVVVAASRVEREGRASSFVSVFALALAPRLTLRYEGLVPTNLPTTNYSSF